jgi:hypothetical protein
LLPLIIGLVLIIAGLGTVAWLMWNEQRQLSTETGDGESKSKESKPELTPATLLKKLGLAEEKSAEIKPAGHQNLLSKLTSFLPAIRKKFSKENLPISTPLPTKLPEEFNRVSAKSAGVGTASLRLDQGLSVSSTPVMPTVTPEPAQVSLEAESDWAFRYDELQKERDSLKEKLERLDALFKEKGDAFDKTEKALASEIKNRKEFNKVKDILEKELKESRDKGREMEVRIAAAQTESSAYLKRVNQLEEKIKTLEKDILEKENEIKEAQGQIQGRQKLIADLEEKLKANEKLIQEKNDKINEIVGKMKEGRPAAEPPAPAPVIEPPPPPEEPAEPAPVSVASEPVAAAPIETPVETETPPAPVPVETVTPSPGEGAAQAEVQPSNEAKDVSQAPPTPAEPAEPPVEEPPQKESPAERKNIILQALEKGDTNVVKPPVPPEVVPESGAQAEMTPETPTAVDNTENPTSIEAPPVKAAENPPEETPTLKLAPDILAQSPEETDKPKAPEPEPSPAAENSPPPETESPKA